jgi:hypothetical protein
MMKKLTEKAMSTQENRIPQLAADAVKIARDNTLKAGRSVIEVKDCQLVETLPDGSVNVIRSLTPPTKVTPGQKLVRKIR